MPQCITGAGAARRWVILIALDYYDLDEEEEEERGGGGGAGGMRRRPAGGGGGGRGDLLVVRNAKSIT